MPKPRDRKKRIAASLEYKSEAAAPLVTALGRGDQAEKIIALAKQAGIPIKEDPDLINIISKVELGQEIPEEVYALVAEILTFVYSVNNDWPEGV